MSQSEFLMYVGTYTRSPEEGIYVYSFDASTGGLQYIRTVTGVSNPSYLTIHPSRPLLYAANELYGQGGKPSGAVTAFAIDTQTGELTFLNSQSSGGAGPCYVSTDYTGRLAFVANYGSGSIAALPIRPDGSLAPASAFIQHQGSGPDPSRQEGPHAHSILPDPTNQYVMACDLGLDKVMIYRVDLDKGTLSPAAQPWAETTPASGPRHLDFHPNGRYLYVATEMGSTVMVFAYNGTRGTLHALQTLSTLPTDWQGDNTGADIHVHPSGKFLYSSNRGHDSIAIFAIDEATGKLTLIGHESTQGKMPRNFVIDPTGTFLLAANQATDNVAVYRIDTATGKLAPTGLVVNITKPVCLKLIARG